MLPKNLNLTAVPRGLLPHTYITNVERHKLPFAGLPPLNPRLPPSLNMVLGPNVYLTERPLLPQRALETDNRDWAVETYLGIRGLLKENTCLLAMIRVQRNVGYKRDSRANIFNPAKVRPTTDPRLQPDPPSPTWPQNTAIPKLANSIRPRKRCKLKRLLFLSLATEQWNSLLLPMEQAAIFPRI